MIYLSELLPRTIKTQICVVIVIILVVAMEVTSLNGPNVCMVKQNYNVTKRIKYRAPMSVRTYEWCFAIPPRCSRWKTEMRDLTKLETEERVAEVAVCCPGYKMKEVACVPICPSGKTGHGCSQDCPPNKWGPNCVHECKACDHGSCSSVTGECQCQDGWQGESCEQSMPTSPPTTQKEELLTTTKSSTKPPITSSTKPIDTTTVRSTTVETTLRTTPTSIATQTTSGINLVTSKTTNLEKGLSELTTIPTTSKEQNNYNYLNLYNKTHVFLLNITNLYSSTAATTEVTRDYTILNNVTKDSVVGKKELQLLNNKNEDRKLTDLPMKETISLVNITENFSVTQSPISKLYGRIATISTTVGTAAKTSTATFFIPSSSTTRITTVAPNQFKSTESTISETTIKTESTTTPETKPETTIRIHPTTTKFRPKEIWIKPAQKGESPMIETKLKSNHDAMRYRNSTKKDFALAITTPRTIIVSIIPTSVSYAIFKKIALTTAVNLAQKNNITIKSYNRSDQGFTKSMSIETTTLTPVTIKFLTTFRNTNVTTITPKVFHNASSKAYISITTKSTLSRSNTTNSMDNRTIDIKHKIKPNPLTTVSPTNFPLKQNVTDITETHTSITMNGFSKMVNKTENIAVTHSSISKLYGRIIQKVTTAKSITNKTSATNAPAVNITKTSTKIHLDNTDNTSIKNITNTSNSKTFTITTEDPTDEETYHILTEPEHITAVMGDKGTEKSSMDLISVISIAGGVMMAVITMAVIIVMIERCKRPRYEDVRKVNDIRMQVMIDNNDVPPPYVRSIFHTPLPDPPVSEKCHYQPLSTLDRNLKQFMRPVVVQTISPLMLENFRGILECHYDHLPRRNHDFGTLPNRFTTAPSMQATDELRGQRAHSFTESAIEALKCEAKLDVIDTTTSEPLYAEIPFWRPPSEHAIEVVNFMNGEAVTEL